MRGGVQRNPSELIRVPLDFLDSSCSSDTKYHVNAVILGLITNLALSNVTLVTAHLILARS